MAPMAGVKTPDQSTGVTGTSSDVFSKVLSIPLTLGSRSLGLALSPDIISFFLMILPPNALAQLMEFHTCTMPMANSADMHDRHPIARGAAC